jgi:galactose mutarotase-like enzyme
MIRNYHLLVNYALIANRLMIVYTVRNYHDQELPFSVGGHPAFNWPLLPGTDARDYFIEFEQAEPLDIWQLEDGLVHPALRPSPVKDKRLLLRADLFDHDALIFPDINSESVFYGNDDAKGLRISYSGFPDLGIWSKPGAPFVCIEPWVGHASPMQFEGEFMQKPGVIVLPSYSERSFSYTLEINT